MKFTASSPAGFAAVYARHVDYQNSYYLTLRPSTGALELKKIVGNFASTLASLTLPSSFDFGQWHTLRIDVSGDSTTGSLLHAYLDGELKLVRLDEPASFTSGKGAVRTYLAPAKFDDIRTDITLMVSLVDEGSRVNDQPAASRLSRSCRSSRARDSSSDQLDPLPYGRVMISR